MKTSSIAKSVASIFFILSFLGAVLIFPARASQTEAGAMAKEIFARLYRNVTSPDIQDFTARFYVKVNSDPADVITNSESDLVSLSRGTLFFKKPYLLRVESNLLYPAGLENADFVLIRDGKFVYAYKNGLDLPIGQDIDNPSHPSNYLPFGLQLPIAPQDLIVTLLGETNSLGVKTYVLGLIDSTDADHDITKVWVDANHYFVRKTEWSELKTQDTDEQITADGGSIPMTKDVIVKVTTLYEDPLQLPNGYWIPMRMERYENWPFADGRRRKADGLGSLAQVVVYSAVSVNSNLSDTLFHAPMPTMPNPYSKFMGENQ